MKVLLFLLLLILITPSMDKPHPFLLIFTSEGTYYKLEVASKHVEWYGSLKNHLLSFEIATREQAQQANSYILPTLDGHFLYIDSHSQILINRKEVEDVLNVCFEAHSRNNNANQPSRYFIYEKYEYYIINLNNGKAEELQTFLKNGFPNNFDKMAVLKVSKKFLKQLRQDLSVSWSTISSEIDVIPAEMFIKDSKASSSQKNKKLLENSDLKFRRVGNNQIQLLNKNESFQIGGTSLIIGIFQFISNQVGYLQHPMEYHYRPKLALQHISNHDSKQLKQIHSIKNSQKINFIHSEQVGGLRKNKNKNSNKELQFCINTFRNLKALTDESKSHHHINMAHISQTNPYVLHNQGGNQSISYRILDTGTSQPQYIIHYGPTEDQPYIWIAIIATIIIFVYWFHKMKINSLLNKFSAMENQTDQKFEEFRKKLDKFEELQKMYEVYWDKVVYKSGGEQCYEHIVYEGKFLNQLTYVYAVRQQGTDVISLQHKLNILLNFSHKGLSKLYYYTKNSEYLLIFTEKASLLSMRKLPDFLNIQIGINYKKSIITEIVEAISYLDNKIQISWLPYESVCFQIKKQAESDVEVSFKLNSIPCLLKKPFDQSQSQQQRSFSSQNNTFQLRLNMVALFHLILHKGQKFNKQYIDQLLKNEAYSQDEYLQFFDFILYQVKSKNSDSSDKQIKQNESDIPENMRALMFHDILDHPFLWDSKRKIMFLSDFSNYIQTHIDEAKVKKLESHAKDYNVIKTPWIKQFHFLFAKEINNYRKYDFQSVRDLIRVIRNKLNHFHQISKEVKNNIGKTPQGFIEYCLELFPKLLHFAYVYARKKKWKLHMK